MTPLAEATFVDLGTAATYSVLAGTGVANTGAGTVLAGDLGLSPTGAITGFPPGTVNGTIHDKDAAAETAQSDRADAYADAAGQASTSTFAGDQAGVTFHPGVHTSAAAVSNTGTITLDADGDSSAVFVFQVGGALAPAAASKVVLTDGALANNVYWQVVGAISLGAGAKFVGTLLGAAAITFGDGASIKGRALGAATVTVTNSPFTEPKDDLTAPIVAIDGGATRSTNDMTPSISGTTDEPVGRAVTVTVGGQTLNGTVGEGGVWSVSAGGLTSGPHDVVASISDASQNTGTATQVLTVDVAAPVVSINGGAARSTSDTTPSISGTTEEPGNRTVTVTVGGQTLTTTAGDGGAWSVDAATLTEAPHNVVASVDDDAQNTGTAAQILTVDVTVPVVTIDGGAAQSTDDTSPWIYGTSAEQAGTKVNVAIGGQALTATVAAGGAWGVSAETLPVASYEVVASITDAAQNTGTATQTLTIHGGFVPSYRPDASIRTFDGDFVGVGIYAPTEQLVTQLLPVSAVRATFVVRLTNRGNTTERLQVRGTPKNANFTVTYVAGGVDVTAAVTAGLYRTGQLAPGATTPIVVGVTKTKVALPGHARRFEIRATSWLTETTWDTVAATVRLTK